MIEHPEDYSDSGPSLPCGDLAGAPVGAGEPARVCGWRACECDCEDYGGPGCVDAAMGRALRRSVRFIDGKPPGGWSDCGPDGEGA